MVQGTAATGGRATRQHGRQPTPPHSRYSLGLHVNREDSDNQPGQEIKSKKLTNILCILNFSLATTGKKKKYLLQFTYRGSMLAF